MNTLQLRDILQSDFEINKHFLGVFPADKAPTDQPGCIIVNEDKSSKPGTHWVAIFRFPSGIVEYFDSYGRDPTATPIKTDLKNQVVITSKKRVQGLLSSTCGQHCIYYLFHRCRGVPFEEIIASYGNYQNENDAMVMDFVESLCESR